MRLTRVAAAIVLVLVARPAFAPYGAASRATATRNLSKHPRRPQGDDYRSNSLEVRASCWGAQAASL